MSSCRSSSIRRPERTIPWSSAIRTLIVVQSSCRRQHHPCPSIGTTEPNPCADVRPGLDLQVAADEQRPLAHAGDSEPASRLVEGEAAPVVGDRELDLPVASRRGDADVLGARVAGGVRERLLRDPVDDELHVARAAPRGRPRPRSSASMPPWRPSSSTWPASAAFSPRSSSAVGRSWRASVSSSCIAWLASAFGLGELARRAPAAPSRAPPRAAAAGRSATG